MELSPSHWPPLCIAHRGFSARYPENTIPAFKAAIALGVDGIETDLQMSVDEELVIYHDRTLKLVGGGLKRVRTQKRADLEQLDFGAWKGEAFESTPMAMFTRVLDDYSQDCTWLWEVKLREGKRERLELLMDKTIAHILERGLEDRVMILCFDLELLATAHARAPQLRYVWNQQWPARYAADADFLFAYSLNHRAVKPDLVSRIQAAGKPVLTYTVDHPKILKRVLQARVNGVMSNDPQWLKEELLKQTGSA